MAAHPDIVAAVVVVVVCRQETQARLAISKQHTQLVLLMLFAGKKPRLGCILAPKTLLRDAQENNA